MRGIVEGVEVESVEEVLADEGILEDVDAGCAKEGLAERLDETPSGGWRV
jgi:hypothetical protein